MSFRRRTVPALTWFSRSHGPPGTACIRVKVIRETTKRTGISQRIRLMTKPTTSTLREHLDLCAEVCHYACGPTSGRPTHASRTDARRAQCALIWIVSRKTSPIFWWSDEVGVRPPTYGWTRYRVTP